MSVRSAHSVGHCDFSFLGGQSNVREKARKSLFQFAHARQKFYRLRKQSIRCRDLPQRRNRLEPLNGKRSGSADWTFSRWFGFALGPFCWGRRAQEGSTNGVVRE